MIKDLGYDYGTNDYMCSYINSFVQNVRIIKLITGDMLIGFQTDGIRYNTTIIDFPFQIISINNLSFNMKEYTPLLELRTITVKDDSVIFSSTPDDFIIKGYLEMLIEEVFPPPTIKDYKARLNDKSPSVNDNIH